MRRWGEARRDIDLDAVAAVLEAAGVAGARLEPWLASAVVKLCSFAQMPRHSRLAAFFRVPTAELPTE